MLIVTTDDGTMLAAATHPTPVSGSAGADKEWCSIKKQYVGAGQVGTEVVSSLESEREGDDFVMVSPQYSGQDSGQIRDDKAAATASESSAGGAGGADPAVVVDGSATLSPPPYTTIATDNSTSAPTEQVAPASAAAASTPAAATVPPAAGAGAAGAASCSSNTLSFDADLDSDVEAAHPDTKTLWGYKRAIKEVISKTFNSDAGHDGADGTFFVGTTGGGKSMTINSLSEKKIRIAQKEIVDEFGSELEEFLEVEDPIHGIEPGDDPAESTTVYVQGHLDEQSGLFFFDTPGFHDTTPTKEVSNAAGLTYAIQRCSSSRLVLIVDAQAVFTGSAKSQYIRQLLELMENFVCNTEDHLGSILVLFTKCKRDENFVKLCRALSKLTTKEDTTTNKFLQRMIDLLKEHKDILLIRPAGEDAVGNAQAIKSLLKSGVIEPITKVKAREIFRTPVGQECARELNTACSNAKETIRRDLAVDITSGNSTVIEQLKLLKYLSKVLLTPEVTVCYTDACKLVLEHALSQLNRASEAVTKYQFDLTKECLEKVTWLHRSDDMKAILAHTSHVDGDNTLKSVRAQLLLSINQKVEEFANACTVADPAYVDLKAVLDHLSSVATNFDSACWVYTKSENRNAYKNARTAVEDRITKLQEETEKRITASDFTTPKFCELLHELKQSEAVDLHIPHRERYSTTIVQVAQAAHDLLDEILALVDKIDKIDDKTFQDEMQKITADAKTAFAHLVDIKSHLRFHLEDASDLCDQATARLDKLVKDLHDRLEATLNEPIPDFGRVKALLHRMNSLADIRLDHSPTIQQKEQCDGRVVSKLEQIMGQAIAALESMKRHRRVSITAILPAGTSFERELLGRYREDIKGLYSTLSAEFKKMNNAKRVWSTSPMPGITNIFDFDRINRLKEDVLIRWEEITEAVHSADLESVCELVETTSAEETQEHHSDGLEHQQESACESAQILISCLVEADCVVGAALPFEVMLKGITRALPNVADSSGDAGNDSEYHSCDEDVAADTDCGTKTTALAFLSVLKTRTQTIADKAAGTATTITRVSLDHIKGIKCNLQQINTLVHLFDLVLKLEHLPSLCQSSKSTTGSANVIPALHTYLKQKREKMIANLAQCARTVDGLCEKSIKDKAFEEVKVFEDEMRTCCDIDALVNSVGHDPIFSPVHKTILLQLSECLNRMQKDGDTFIAENQLDGASTVLADLDGLLCLRHLFAANPVPIEDIHSQLQTRYAKKTDGFAATVLTLLEQEKFTELVSVLKGATTLTSEGNVVKGKEIVHKECKKRYDLVLQILNMARKARGPVAIPAEIHKSGVMLQWFDRAKQLQAALAGNQFQDWHRTLLAKITDLLGRANAQGNTMLDRWKFTETCYALQELEMFVTGFPAEIQDMTLAMQEKLKTALGKRLETCVPELQKSLDECKVESINSIMSGIEGLVLQDSGQVNMFIPCSTTELFENCNKHIQQALAKRCGEIVTSIKTFQFEGAQQNMEFMSRLRSQAPKWVSKNLYATKFSEESLDKLFAYQMEQVLQIEWISASDMSIAEKTKILEACSRADTWIYEMKTKALIEKLNVKLGPLTSALSTSKNKWNVKQAEKWAKQMTACLAVLPQESTASASLLESAGRDLYECVKFQVEDALSDHSDAKKENRWKDLGQTAPFLEAAAAAMTSISELSGDKATTEGLAAKIKTAILPDQTLVRNLLKGYKEVKDLDLLAGSAAVDPRHLRKPGTIAWTIATMKEKDSYLKTIPELESIGEAYAVIKMVQKKMKMAAKRKEELWASGNYSAIAFLYENMNRMVDTFAPGQDRTHVHEVHATATETIREVSKFIETSSATLESSAVAIFLDQFGSRAFKPSSAKAKLEMFDALVRRAVAVEKAFYGGASGPSNCQGIIYSRIIEESKKAATSYSLKAGRQDVSQVSAEMLKYYAVTTVIKSEAVKEGFEECIGIILDECVVTMKTELGFDIAGLDAELSKDKLGAEITKKPKFAVFKRFRLGEWKARVIKKTFKDALTDVKSLKANKVGADQEKQLLTLYEKYSIEYTLLVERYKHDPNDDTRLAEVSADIRKRIKSSTRIAMAVKEQLALLVADIFAVWSMTEVYNPGEKDVEYKEPFALQILSIFFLFGLQNVQGFVRRNIEKVCPSSVKLEQSHFIQILTGQGKSITLGVLSASLALVGYDVDCVCFSPYLSERDAKAFAAIFDALGVTDKITYGTFGTLSNKLVNKEVDLRETTAQLLNGDEIRCSPAGVTGRTETVVLLDEVDVLFSSDFYGQTYNPAARLNSKPLVDLIDLAWSKRRVTGLESVLLASEPFKKLIADKKHCSDVFRDTVKQMVADLKQLPYHQYVVQNGEIGYADGCGGISTSTSYGCKTLWAAFQEHEEDPSFNVTKSITPMCGLFSYAEIPKMYDVVLGVTGTLYSLPPPLLKTLKKRYRISKFTEMPSIFGERKLKAWKENQQNVIVAKNESNQHMKLADIIQQKAMQNGQPVIVFFDSDKEVNKFWESDYCKSIYSAQNMFKVVADTENVQWHIDNATRLTESGWGNVTLFSKELGRGTDYVPSASSIDTNGGVVVIQTFFSEDISEQIQIEGRTARNGANGEFYLILEAAAVCRKYKVTQEELAAHAEGVGMYGMLEQKRAALCKRKCTELDTAVDKAKESHDRTLSYQEALKTAAADGSIENLELCAALLRALSRF